MWFLHIGNVLTLFAYTVKDIMALRVLAVLADLTFLPYYLTRPEPEGIEWGGVVWSVIFMAINGERILALYRERRPVELTVDEQRLYNAAFGPLKAREFAKLARAGKWRTAAKGEQIHMPNEVLDQFLVLVSGRVAVERDGTVLMEAQGGDFIGDASLTSDSPTTAGVHVKQETDYLSWTRDDLRKILEADPKLHATVQSIVSRYLIRKLTAAGGPQALAAP